MSILNRHDIKSKKPINGEPLYVPAWDGEVCIRKWSGAQRAQLLSRVAEVYPNGAMEGNLDVQNFPTMFLLMAEIVAVSLCDADANNLYDVGNPDDVREIENFDADLLQFLFEECAKRNGLLETQIKQEIKNSETTQS